jgi:hypothetical protein
MLHLLNYDYVYKPSSYGMHARSVTLLGHQGQGHTSRKRKPKAKGIAKAVSNLL